jgi:hypothetical protein
MHAVLIIIMQPILKVEKQKRGLNCVFGFLKNIFKTFKSMEQIKTQREKKERETFILIPPTS